MNQIATTHEPVKQNWMKRTVTAVAKACFAWICWPQIDISSPHETQMFMNYSSYGWEEACMHQYYAQVSSKWEEEV